MSLKKMNPDEPEELLDWDAEIANPPSRPKGKLKVTLMRKMTRVRRKPIVLEAFQWKGLDSGEWPEWLKEAAEKAVFIMDPIGGAHIHTREGRMEVNMGDWIIKGVKGELYPVGADIFDEIYEIVPE